MNLKNLLEYIEVLTWQEKFTEQDIIEGEKRPKEVSLVC